MAGPVAGSLAQTNLCQTFKWELPSTKRLVMYAWLGILSPFSTFVVAFFVFVSEISDDIL
jgi:hypothetical protein